VADSDPAHRLPQVWRIPPWQPAALILTATALAAVDIYVRPAPLAMFAAAFVAAAALLAAVCAMRYLLVADEDGIWVRRVFREVLVEWGEIARVEMTTHRGAMTVRVTRTNGSYVDVPPSLLLPTVPRTLPKVRTIIHGVAMHLGDLATAQQR
jgi:hypothetical protein